MLDLLFGWSDPTRRFPPRSVTVLSLDASRGELSGIRLGAEVAALAPLGRATAHQRTGNQTTLVYPDLALVATVIDGRLWSVHVSFDSQRGPHAGQYDLREGGLELRTTGRSGVRLDRRTSERDILAALGAPPEKYEDEEALEWIWEFQGTCELTLALDPKRRSPIGVSVSTYVE